MIQKETGATVRKAIESLPANQRTALNLKLEGMSYAEIAELMETTVSAVETRLFRARQALEKKLSGLI
jgi:RNA polymerase sigma-70 factor (ECF subfamily)